MIHMVRLSVSIHVTLSALAVETGHLAGLSNVFSHSGVECKYMLRLPRRFLGVCRVRVRVFDDA